MTDVEQIARGLSKAQRMGLDYHTLENRGSSCGDMKTDLALVFSGFLDFGDDGRLHATPLGLRVRQWLLENWDGS